jgi:hypothetical protein
MAVTLRQFHPVHPKDFLTGTWGEWANIILLCAFFIALFGAVLPRHLTESFRGKAISTVLGIIVGLGLYKAQQIYRFNFESFGMIAIGLLVIVAAIVTYKLTRHGWHPDIAAALTYCLIFLSFSMPKPSIFDAFAEYMPILNTIFYGAFFYLLGRLMFTMFRRHDASGSISAGSRMLDRIKSIPKRSIETERQIEKEIHDDKVEDAEIKRKSIKLTKRELNSVDDMNADVNDMQTLIQKKGNSIDQDEIAQLKNRLRRLRNEGSTIVIKSNEQKRELNLFKLRHSKKLEEIRNKLSIIKNNNQRKPLLLQIDDHKKALSLIELLKELDIKIQNIKRSFDRMIFTAMQRIAQKNPSQANELLRESKRHLASLKAQIENQKRMEKGLIDINNKTIKDLKREKEALNR